MRITTSIEKLANDIGFDVANSTDVVQADLLNGLGRGFHGWAEANMDMQLCYLTQHLTPEAKKFIKMLNDYANPQED